jgi:aspartyl protease family protein
MTTNKNKLGQYFWLAFWVVLIALFSYVFSIKQNNDVIAISPSHLKVAANTNGHYLLNGTINGVEVQYLVDTGATDVVIPAHIADKMQLKKGPAISVRTANGTTSVYLTRIEKLTIDSIELHNIRANINPQMGSSEAVLLGMSALKQLEIRQLAGELHLIQK